MEEEEVRRKERGGGEEKKEKVKDWKREREAILQGTDQFTHFL